MMEKEELGLNLSLGFTQKHHSLQLNLNPNPSKSLSSSSPSSVLSLHKLPWNQAFLSPDSNPRFLRGIDVNRVPIRADCEENGDIISSPKSTVSCVSSKRNEREGNLGEDQEIAERGYCRGSSDEEGGENSRKKMRLSKDQSAFLEDTFKKHNSLNPNKKLALAKKLGLRPRQVEVWFQNRRARTKLKQTEVDREHLRLSCETLMEENRRLQKEASELRALKLSPHFYDSTKMVPPTTLIMCPSCEPVAAPPRFATLAAHYPRSNHWVQGPTPPSDVLRL